jgi:hypothetical protein
MPNNVLGDSNTTTFGSSARIIERWWVDAPRLRRERR